MAAIYAGGTLMASMAAVLAGLILARKVFAA